MTYRQLQIKLNKLREEGKVAWIRLNQKKEELERVYNKYLAKIKKVKEEKKVIKKGVGIVNEKKKNRKVQRDAIKNREVQAINKFKEQIEKLLSTKEEQDIDISNISIKKIMQLLINKVLGNKIMIKINDTTFYTLKPTTLESIMEKLINEEVIGGSYGEVINNIVKVNKITIFIADDSKVKNVYNNGSYFPYYNKTNLDLSKYGIFKNREEANYDDNCLMKALREYGLEDSVINRIKSQTKNSYIPICKLNDISSKILRGIRLTHKQKGGITKTILYNQGNYKEIIPIGLLEEHYFLNDKIELNEFAINNYDDIKDRENWNRINKKRKNPKGIMVYEKNIMHTKAFLCLYNMLEKKDTFFKKITVNNGLLDTQYAKNNFEITDLNYNEETDTRKMEYEPKEQNSKYKIFFDFETITEGEHVPYLCCLETEDGKKRSYYGPKCGLDMLNDILKMGKKDVLMIAHNLRYDYSFIVDYLWADQPTLKGGKLMNCYAKFGTKNNFINIQLKDSYSMISMPLKEFCDAFKLTKKKEVMPYKLYTKENLQRNYVTLKEAKRIMKKKDYAQLLKNCKEWDLLSTDEKSFSIVGYSRDYCHIDCSVLRKGYEKFREWILEVCELDIDNIISAAGLAHQFLYKEGCYEDVYELAGVPRLFIEKCLVGGRCMSRDNKKYHIKNRKINDIDAISLYPSSMYYLCGYLKGKPKVIPEDSLNYKFLKKQDGYFIQIKIDEIGKDRHFPLLSKLKKDGVREFTNDMIGKEIFVDKIAFEDLIKFQKIKYTIIRGYYFNEGRNKKIVETIKNLFEKRKEEKKKKNPIESVYKLIMNSAYGKTILKSIDEKVSVIKKKDFDAYLFKRYNYIKECHLVGNKYYVYEIKPINDHFNCCHVGIEILSMSKRIMNKVMCLAEDNNLTIYYQDTDSIHCVDKDIAKLEKLYRKKYGKELIGADLGQFHSDFKLKGCENIYSQELIILGKKCYYDELVGTDKEGNTRYGEHIRMKGTPNQSILHKSKDVKGIYLKGLEGKKLKFDLTCGGEKACFKGTKNMKMSTLTDFTRVLQFKGEYIKNY